MVSRAQFSKVRESPKGMRILKFLRRQPMPAKILGETPEGETVSCVIPKKPNTAAWTDAVRVLLECEKLKALDADDNSLRVLEFDPDDPALQAEEETVKARARSKDHGSAPIISVDVPRLVDNIAKNLKEVAVTAAGMQADAFKAGMAAMTAIMNTTLNMVVRLEERLSDAEEERDQARNEALQLAAAATQTAAEPEGSERERMAMMALQKVIGGGGEMSGLGLPAEQMSALGQLLQGLQARQQGAQANGA
jgi:hypothetical protein